MGGSIIKEILEEWLAEVDDVISELMDANAIPVELQERAQDILRHIRSL